MDLASRTFPATPDSVAEARRFVAQYFTPGPHRDDAILLVSEVATNAIRHVGGEYVIAIQDGVGFTRVLVGDCGQASTVPYARPASATRESGRGLALVEALAARWGTARGTGGAVVWFEIAHESVAA